MFNTSCPWCRSGRCCKVPWCCAECLCAFGWGQCCPAPCCQQLLALGGAPGCWPCSALLIQLHKHSVQPPPHALTPCLPFVCFCQRKLALTWFCLCTQPDLHFYYEKQSPGPCLAQNPCVCCCCSPTTTAHHAKHAGSSSRAAPAP